MTICQLRHTIVRNAFLNFIVVELMRCFFSIDSRATYGYSDFVTNFKLCRLNIYMYIFPINSNEWHPQKTGLIYMPILKSEKPQKPR